MDIPFLAPLAYDSAYLHGLFCLRTKSHYLCKYPAEYTSSERPLFGPRIPTNNLMPVTDCHVVQLREVSPTLFIPIWQKCL